MRAEPNNGAGMREASARAKAGLRGRRRRHQRTTTRIGQHRGFREAMEVGRWTHVWHKSVRCDGAPRANASHSVRLLFAFVLGARPAPLQLVPRSHEKDASERFGSLCPAHIQPVAVLTRRCRKANDQLLSCEMVQRLKRAPTKEIEHIQQA